MSRPITHVKQEIRILGLDTCNPRFTVGAVVRGGRFLDGVIVYSRGQPKSAGELLKRITNSKYFPELRAIMLHDPTGNLDSELIQRKIRLPVINVSNIGHGNEGSYRAFRKNRRQLWFKAQIETSTVQRILSLVWIKDRLPEPLRIAHLLAKRGR